MIGKGNNSLIFLNGAGVPYKSWDKIYSKVSSHNTVLLFNRHGVGASSRATVKQDGITIIKEMDSLFRSLNVSIPTVLVAHSWGGVFANLYARVYPDNVKGIVFVDSPHPSFIAIEKTYKFPLPIRLIIEGLQFGEKLLDLLKNSKDDEFKYSEDVFIDETVRQIENAGPFPVIPIAVVTGMRRMPFIPQGSFDDFQHYQEELLNLSPKRIHYQCKKSGHFPQIDEPERVITAIQDLLLEIKSVNKQLH